MVAVMSVPAAVVARTTFATLASSQIFWLSRSTSRKSARMPFFMISAVMLTMWAWRMPRRFTTSVICIRVFNSFICACTAKMLTWLDSISSSTWGGMSVNGRGAYSSSTKVL